MSFAKSLAAAAAIASLAFAAPLYAAPNWGGAPAPATTTTTTTQGSPWAHPAGTTPSPGSLNQMNNVGLAQPREDCAFNAQQTGITVTNVSLMALPKGYSAVTICNMHQPGMPPANSACG